VTDRGRTTIADFVERAYAVLGEMDYYRILGVGRDASGEAVRTAYYKLAQRLHPDVHGVDVEPGFKQKLTAVYSRVVEAYQVLASSSQRQRYDEGLSDGELRIQTGVKVVPKPEEMIEDAGARRFYMLGMEALAAGDGKSAVMNLKMALSRESSGIIRDALGRAEAVVKLRR
jgi:curved DNA-binding protein CbpA